MTRLLQKLSLLCLAFIASLAINAETVTDTIAFYEMPNAEIAQTGTASGKNCTISWSGLGSTSSNVYINSTTGKYYNKYTSSTAYVLITPTAPEKCKVGDVVSITINNSSVKSDGGCYIHAANGNKVNTAMTAANEEVTATYTLTSDDIEDDGSIKFFRIGSNTRVHSYLVTRQRTIRTFEGFEISLQTATPTLPSGVTQVSYTSHAASYHQDNHGWQWYAVKFSVDGAVKITLGGCQYANTTAEVTDANGTQLATIDTKSCGCYHNGGTATWTYNSKDANTLIVYCGEYCPYIKVEPVEYQEDATIKYYNTDGTKIGEESVKPGSALAYKYGAADVTVSEGKAFRGWFTSVGRKTAAGETVQGDMSLYATATYIEHATTTARYTYNLKNPYWYQEDHECIDITKGTYKDETHGWTISDGGTIALKVGGKAYIKMDVCKYSAAGDAVMRDASGAEVGKFTVSSSTVDGSSQIVYYSGEATTMTITFAGTNYVHGITIYNVIKEVTKENGYYQIPANDANSFLLALAQATSGDKIYLPNGTYDLGELVLTSVSKNNISIIGESMNGTIIKNAPAAETESINNTATLFISGSTGTYLQDLTLQNDLDYYKNNNGRAVALHDEGSQTICKNVKLMSYQDTYYSNKVGASDYFEGGEIHGTVDYICGGGNVYFNGVKLVCEKRQTAGGGADAVTASNAQSSDKGYVFDGCTLQYVAGMTADQLPVISLGRSWNNSPKCVFLNTTVDNTNGTMKFEDNNGTIKRWTLAGMNVLPTLLGEYNTKNEKGEVISPESNNITFTYNGATKDMNTILSSTDAAKYTMAYTLGSWATTAQTEATQITTWPTEGIFLVNGTITTTRPTSGYARVANTRGGFGPTFNAATGEIATAINAVNADANVNANANKAQGKFVQNGKLVIVKDGKKYTVSGVELK